ncbi:MAG: hypothetical protein Q9184_004828 [Pyrenodesmia sp. 2 TL-2023]
MDFSNFTDDLSAFEGMPVFDPNLSDLFLDDQIAALGNCEADVSILEGWQQEKTPETSIDPALLGLDSPFASLDALEADHSVSEGWQAMENLETSIDPVLLTTSDPSLDPFAGFDPSATTFWDAGSEWQPLNTESYPDPTLLNPFDAAIDPFAMQALLDFNASSACVPLSTEVSKATNPSVKQKKTSPVTVATNATTKQPTGKGKWIQNPYNQPRVDSQDCPCSLCRGGPVNLSVLWKDKKSAKIMAKRSQYVQPKSKARKRKAQEMTPEEESEDSDSSLSSVPDLEDGSGSSDAEDQALSDYGAPPPRKVVKKSRRAAQPAPKKRKVAWTLSLAEDSASPDSSDHEAPPRKVARRPAPKKPSTRSAAQPEKVLPKGLEIDMRKW